MEYRFYLYHQETGYQRIKDPVGWDSLGKTLKRYGVDNAVGQKWHGIFVEYSPKLRFIKDGKKFLQYYYERDGIEAEVMFRLDKKNLSTRKWAVDYEGKVNFTSYKVSTIAVEVNIENTGFLQKLKNRMDVKVNLQSLVSQGGKAITPFANETVDVEMHSKVILKSLRNEMPDDGDTATIIESPFNIDNNNPFYIIPELQETVNEGIGESNFGYPLQFRETPPTDDLLYLFNIKESGLLSYNLKFVARLKCTLRQVPDGVGLNDYEAQVRGSVLFIRRVKATGALEEISEVFWLAENFPVPACDFGTHLGGTECHTNYNSGFLPVEDTQSNITVTAGDEFYVYFKNNIFDSFPAPAVIGLDPEFTFRLQDGDENFVSVTSLTSFDTTTSKTVLIHEAWTRVLQSITDTADPFRSEYFGRTDSEPVAYDVDGAGSLRAYTNGNQLRLLDVPIYCSLKDLIEATAAIDGIGIGIEKSNGVERVRVEPITYFYQAKRTLRLDYCKDIEKEVLDALYFNQLEAGIDKWRTSTGNINNLDEFVANKQWTLPITQIKNLLSLKSPIITSGYMIEFARRASVEPTKDTDRDNDGYFIQLRRDGGDLVTAKDEDFTSVTGLFSPETSYNLELSPGRCVRRNGRLLRAGLEKYKDQYIKFSFGEANNAMVTQKTGEDAITENADILISTLDAPLFLAEVYTVRARLTRQQLEALNTTDPDAAVNVFGYAEFSSTNKDYKRGWVIEARPAADSNETIFKLLRANV